jgi:hypothetical protein
VPLSINPTFFCPRILRQLVGARDSRGWHEATIQQLAKRLSFFPSSQHFSHLFLLKC